MLLSQEKTMSMLSKHKIPICKSVICKTPKQAQQATAKIGFPLVLKLMSKDIIHKSDMGAVATGISSTKQLLEEIAKRQAAIKKKLPDAKIEYLLQEQVSGRELIIGMKRDAQFGPVIVFGLGGIFVEVLKDVSMRIAPLTKKDAQDMISQIRGKKILEGVRGQKPVNLKAIENILLSFSKLAIKEKNIEEIDFNPVMADDRKAVVVDARILMKEPGRT